MPAGDSWLDDARALIGTTARRVTGTATIAQIRRFAQATGDPDPLYRDFERLRAIGPAGVPAPLLFDENYLDLGGTETERQVLPSGSSAEQLGQGVPLPPEMDESLAGGCTYTLYRRVQSGDVITATSTLADVFEKSGRRGGRMAFLVYDTTLVNQRGETVLTRRQTMIRRAKSGGE